MSAEILVRLGLERSSIDCEEDHRAIHSAIGFGLTTAGGLGLNRLSHRLRDVLEMLALGSFAREAFESDAEVLLAESLDRCEMLASRLLVDIERGDLVEAAANCESYSPR